jgi:hypothetical protein
LPLIQLKERRRDLIVALMGRHGPLSERQIAEIASIQRTEGHVGAVAFSRMGDPGSGEFADAVLLKSFWRSAERSIGALSGARLSGPWCGAVHG